MDDYHSDYHEFVKEMEHQGLDVRIEYYRYRSLFTIDPVTLEVFYCHPSKLMRYYRRTKRNKKQFMPHPKGGMSVFTIYDGDVVLARGVGKCMKIDNFAYAAARGCSIDNMEWFCLPADKKG